MAVGGLVRAKTPVLPSYPHVPKAGGARHDRRSIALRRISASSHVRTAQA
jgi:hypothetical protein